MPAVAHGPVDRAVRDPQRRGQPRRAATDPFPEGARAAFRTRAAAHSWMAPLRDLGMWTASISTFAERHSAYHFDAGFNECVNLGTRGHGDGRPGGGRRPASGWPATPAATTGSSTSTCGTPTPPTAPRPASATRSPAIRCPDWLTEEVRAAHWQLPGPHSAQELAGFGPRDVWDRWPRQPLQAASMDDVRRVYDGYDTGVRYADHHDRPGARDARPTSAWPTRRRCWSPPTTARTSGELGIYCDHQTADQITTRLPAVSCPLARRLGRPVRPAPVDTGFHYQIDVMATVLELAGAEVPARWDGVSFAPDLRAPGARPAGDHLVLSHARLDGPARRCASTGGSASAPTTTPSTGSPTCCCSTSRPTPTSSTTVAADHPDVVEHAWPCWPTGGATPWPAPPTGVDPLWTVLTGGGPWHSRVDVPLVPRPAAGRPVGGVGRPFAAPGLAPGR